MLRSRSRRGRCTRQSLGQAPEQLAVLFDDLAEAVLECRLGVASLDGLPKGDLRVVVESLSLGSRASVSAASASSSRTGGFFDMTP